MSQLPKLEASSATGSGQTGRNSWKAIRDRMLVILKRTNSQAKRLGFFANQESEKRWNLWALRMMMGQTSDYRAPIFIKERDSFGKPKSYLSYEEIVARWKRELVPVPGLNPDQYELLTSELELPQCDKIGPQSTFQGYLSDGTKKIGAVWRPKPVLPELNRRAAKNALDWYAALVPQSSIQMMSLDETLEAESEGKYDIIGPGIDPTTNSGPPWFKSKWKDFVFEGVKARAFAFLPYLEAGERVPILIVAGQRLVQTGRDGAKSPKHKRYIMAVEKAETALGKRVLFPMMEVQRTLMPFLVQTPLHVAWMDLPYIDWAMQEILANAGRNNRAVLSADLSNFDASFPQWLISDIARVWGSWVKGGDKYVPALVESTAYASMLLTPNRVWLPTPHSVVSGSWWTNDMDSAGNIIAVKYGEELGSYKIEAAAVQGDDLVVDGPGVTPESVAQAYAAYGMAANASKQTYLKGALSFLQRFHLQGWIGGIYPFSRALGSALNYEQLTYSAREWNKYDYAIQIENKLENCAFSPWLERGTEFVAKGDKYQLWRRLDPEVLVKRSGPTGLDILQRQLHYSIQRSAMPTTETGFAQSVINGVLRGEVLPPLGSVERFIRAYRRRVDDDLLSKVKAVLNLGAAL